MSTPPADPQADPHPLLPVLLRAAGGGFPPVDGRVEHLPPLAGGLRCVVSFTGHAYVASDQPPADFADLALDGFGAALHPAALLRLAGPGGEVGVLDCTLAGTGRGPGDSRADSAGGGNGGVPALPARPDLADHPRVRHARAIRQDVRVYGDDRGLVTLARGLAGRLELSIEVAAGRQGQGLGPGLLADGLRLVEPGAPVFAGVSPGNVRSLRAFHGAGFQVVGSEVIVVPASG